MHFDEKAKVGTEYPIEQQNNKSNEEKMNPNLNFNPKSECSGDICQ